MKKLLLYALLSASATTFAQIKIKAGTNISSFTGHSEIRIKNNYSYLKYEDITKSKVGFYVGAGYEIHLTDKFSFTPELLYSQTGAKEKEFINDRKKTYYQHYLSLPIFFEYEVFEKATIGLGPQIDYLISSNYKIDWKTTNDIPGAKRNTGMKDTEMYKKISYGVTAGFSYNFYNNISFEARYYLGLSNIFNEEKIPEFSNVTAETSTEIKNRYFQIGISYKFN